MNKPSGNSDKGTKPAAREQRYGAPRAVSALLAPLTRRALGKHGFSSATLISDWATIIGDELAASCQPIKLAFQQGSRDSGMLHLRVSSGAALEIQHITPQIIDRINGHLGYHAVERLKLIQGPMPRTSQPRRKHRALWRAKPAAAPKPCKELDDITDPALRESLERLGKAIAAREVEAKK